MPAQHVGSLDAWLESSFTSGSSIGCGVAPGCVALGRSRGSHLSGASRTISAGGCKSTHKGLQQARVGIDAGQSTDCQPVASICTDGRGAISAPFPLSDPKECTGSGTDQFKTSPFATRGRPPSGPCKRQSLLSLQLRSASSLPVHSYLGSDHPSDTPSLPRLGEGGWSPELEAVSSAKEPLRSSPFAAACSGLRAQHKAPGRQGARSMDTPLGCTSLAAASTCRAAADNPFSVFAYPSAASSICHLPDCSDPDAMTCGGSVAYSSSGGFYSSGSNILHYRDENSGATSRFHQQLSSPTRGPEACLAACFASNFVKETSSTAVADFFVNGVGAPVAVATTAESATAAIDAEEPAAVPGVAAAAAATPSVCASCTADAQGTAAEGASVAAPSGDDGAKGEAGSNAAATATATAAATATATATAAATATATATATEASAATATAQGQNQHQHRTLAETNDDASCVRAVAEPVSGGTGDGEWSRRGRGSKAFTFASLFSTVLVLPQDGAPRPTDRCSGVSGCLANGGPAGAEGARSSGNNHNLGFAAESVGTGISRAVLTHSLSLGRAGIDLGAREGECDAWGRSEEGYGKLAALQRGNWSLESGEREGGSNSIRGLLMAEVEPAMYEGTVRRGLPRRAAMGRALSQPITQEMLCTLLDSVE